jgi:multiple sugar transport system substrate-binding protein
MSFSSRFVAAGFFIALALIIAACSPAPAATRGALPARPSGEIRFLISEDPIGEAGYRQIIDAFAKVQPDVKVRLENVPDDGEFLKRLAADFAARTPPAVFVINYRRFGQFAIKGALQPIDDYIAKSAQFKPDDFYPTALDAFKLKGKQYCIPQNLSSLEVYYNKKLFAAANLPMPRSGWTWDEFLHDAHALTRSTKGDGKIDQYGAGIATSTIRLAPFIWAHGGELVDNTDRPTRLTLDAGPALEAFQWFVNLQVKEHVVPSKADEATENSLSRFQHGTLGMFFQSRVITPDFRETIKDFDWDVAPLPGDKNTVTILHSDGYCITSASQNKDAAWAFVEFANSTPGQQVIVKSGRTVPSLKRVAESPLFLDTALAPSNSRAYLDMAPGIRRVPIMTNWVEIEDVVNKEIQRAFYGDASTGDAAQAAVKGTGEFFKQNLGDLGAP